MPVNITNRQFEIIKAAGKILTESGVSGLTIKKLAKEMKFSEAAIYRHFSSKEDIVVSLLEYLAQNIDDRCTYALSSNLLPEEKFIMLFQNQFTFFNANPHFVVAVFSDGLMEESERINQTILKILGVKLKHLMPIILEGQEKHIFTNQISSEDLVQIVMGTFRLQMYKWRLSNFQSDIIENGEKMIRAVLILIKNK